MQPDTAHHEHDGASSHKETHSGGETYADPLPQEVLSESGATPTRGDGGGEDVAENNAPASDETVDDDDLEGAGNTVQTAAEKEDVPSTVEYDYEASSTTATEEHSSSFAIEAEEEQDDDRAAPTDDDDKGMTDIGRRVWTFVG